MPAPQHAPSSGDASPRARLGDAGRRALVSALRPTSPRFAPPSSVEARPPSPPQAPPAISIPLAASGNGVSPRPSGGSPKMFGMGNKALIAVLASAGCPTSTPAPPVRSPSTNSRKDRLSPRPLSTNQPPRLPLRPPSGSQIQQMPSHNYQRLTSSYQPRHPPSCCAECLKQVRQKARARCWEKKAAAQREDQEDEEKDEEEKEESADEYEEKDGVVHF
ncbi:hypothetical protein PHYSODRAFT_260184 [Phytophthora sojae]|uniref:Uncharacterized protein n=1 Tax=Phytophthora sojae (strain P6497) TaxID=1094619 RepID=G4YV36_PHYSP|nr:hypothetical protein PHYSODRAFT_260184 [Phytophthora sojae]EGZ24335.1 hypothetical protein PHYSODRAFT_260184 [Phytophthora sojae]|eukprot:XP_009519623.1 hypothetical protein PHYSODRAFT_260184 [Phytophthora sojae]